VPSAFTTEGEPSELPGIGVVNEQGVPIDRAALVMGELQDDKGRPLTGSTLLAAAKKYAEQAGITVTTSTDDTTTTAPKGEEGTN